MHSSLSESIARFADIAREPIDLAREIIAITFAIATRSLFGARMTVEEAAQISEATIRIQNFILCQVTQPYLVPWLAASGEQHKHEVLCQGAFDVLRRHIKASDRRAFLGAPCVSRSQAG